MNIIAPKDKTPIRINGQIVDNTIKNPINFTATPKNYTLTSVPKKIKIDVNNINTKEIIEKSTQLKTDKIFSSKKIITSNKKTILDKFIGNKEINNIIDISNNNQSNILDIKSDTVDVKSDGVDVKSNVLDIKSDAVDVKSDINLEINKNITNITEVLKDIPKKDILSIKKRKLTRKVNKLVKKKKVIASKIPDYDKMTDDQKLMHRNDFILKYDLLRKWHPGLNIQKGIENHDNLKLVHSVYELYLGCIYNEINSNFWRGVLLLTWAGLELFGVYVLGLDTSDYLKQQINLMWAYEPIINEFSKVNFYHVVEGWSPFQKLIGLVFGSYVFIIVIKLILSFVGKKIGHNIDGLTSTVVEFISSMVFSKPKDNTIPSIVINNTGQTQSSSILNNLGGIHNISIPQASSLSLSNQVNLIQGTMDTIGMVSGKKITKPIQANPAQNDQKSRFVAPSF